MLVSGTGSDEVIVTVSRCNNAEYLKIHNTQKELCLQVTSYDLAVGRAADVILNSL
jgi:hypothetical protein